MLCTAEINYGTVKCNGDCDNCCWWVKPQGMTREEATERLKAILEEATSDEDAVCYVTSYDADALDMAIKALEQEPRWIPVSERLPESTDYYLVTVGINEYGLGMISSVRTALYNVKTNDWTIHTGTNMCLVGEVVAWCDCLPEPYKAESEDKE